jgi:predicted ATP-dependent endonuclease of OLD family
MAVNRVEIKDFLVFKGQFAIDFCSGVNVLIGGNGTGKTTLIKTIYNSYCLFRGNSLDSNATSYLPYFTQVNSDISPKIYNDKNGHSNVKEIKHNMFAVFFNLSSRDYHAPNEQKMCQVDVSAVFIPEKDILEHAKGLLPFIEQKQTGFSAIYKDVLIAAQDVPTQEQSEMQKSVGQKITAIIGGVVQWEQSEGMFYTIRTNGMRIPFIYEASGFKKLGYLGLLVTSGQIEPGSILFWDEPENSLNPEFIPALVNILLELSRNGVQIFLATHSEILASYFAVNRKKGDSVMFYSLYKDGEQIKASANDRFDILEPNNLKAEIVNLYKKEIERGLGGNG